jgi:GNAT superfamily N-acetyltransferase
VRAQRVIPHAVRRAEPSDLEALILLCSEHAAFEQASFDSTGKLESLKDAMFGDGAKLNAWVAVVGTHLAGYATATVNFSTWSAAPFLYMDCLFVRAIHRNAGIGASFLAAVRRFAKEQGLNEVQWQTPAWNSDACRFYRRNGGTELPKIRFSTPA